MLFAIPNDSNLPVAGPYPTEEWRQAQANSLYGSGGWEPGSSAPEGREVIDPWEPGAHAATLMANVVVNDPSCDSKPIPQIRLLRERLGISLRDAKVAIEAARERKRQAQAGADLAEV